MCWPTPNAISEYRYLYKQATVILCMNVFFLTNPDDSLKMDCSPPHSTHIDFEAASSAAYYSKGQAPYPFQLQQHSVVHVGAANRHPVVVQPAQESSYVGQLVFSSIVFGFCGLSPFALTGLILAGKCSPYCSVQLEIIVNRI